MKVIYTGKTQVSVAGIGIVDPQQIIETEIIINHPLFKKYPEIKKEKRK